MKYVLGLLVVLLSGPVLACTVAPSFVTEFPDSVVQSDGAISFYDKGTDRYPHAVLGDDIEPTVLHFDNAEVFEQTGLLCGIDIQLPDYLVFEDLAPRLVDLDGDNSPEIITTRSHQDMGAQVAIYDMIEGELRVIAETPFIGTRFRWLAIIGAADMNADGYIEIAYIDRPHLAKTLRIWTHYPKTSSLRQIASMPGLSNHRIGEDFITSVVRACDDDVSLLVPDANRRELIQIGLENNSLKTQSLGPFSNDLLASSARC